MHAATGTGRLIAGRYRLQDPIGRGAMGIVWRGRDELLARDVAIKEVQITSHADPADAEALYQRTLREARTAARLNHPSVVTVYDVVEENASPWIVMELVEARSLDRIIIEDGPLPPLQAAQIGASLVSALATAHAAGVLHRDVKPSNVLVTSDGRAVLTDFGIAMFAEDPAMTLAGMVVGTPGFTAPERIRGDVASAASDLWSVGATLYAAVEGRGPFDRVGGSSVISAGVALEDAPTAPSAGPLGPVINALLSKDPGTRPDATTAGRLLADAETVARTGERMQGEDWRAAELDGNDRTTDMSTGNGAGDSAIAASESGPDPAAPAKSGLAGGPVLWRPIGPGGSGRRGDGGPSGPASGPGGGEPTEPADPAKRSSGPWRLIVTGIAIVAIAAAAIVGWNMYSHSHSAQALQSSLPPGVSAPAAAGGNGPGDASKATPANGTSGKTPGSTNSGGALGSHPSANSSGQPSGSPTPGNGATASPTPSPASSSPSPPTTPPVLPPGYKWNKFSPLVLGSTAGFKIGMPDAWTQSIGVLLAHLNMPLRGFHLTVGLDAWAYIKPLAQAHYLYNQDRVTYHNFRLLTISSVQFSRIGGYKTASAAELKFSWTKITGGSFTELVILVTLNTKLGQQPYAFTLWAPANSYSAAHDVFRTALPTFRPVTS